MILSASFAKLLSSSPKDSLLLPPSANKPSYKQISPSATEDILPGPSLSRHRTRLPTDPSNLVVRPRPLPPRYLFPFTSLALASFGKNPLFLHPALILLQTDPLLISALPYFTPSLNKCVLFPLLGRSTDAIYYILFHVSLFLISSSLTILFQEFQNHLNFLLSF